MKKQPRILSLTLFLLAVAAICGTLVAGVNSMTSGVIAQMEQDAMLAGYATVFPGLESIKKAEYTGQETAIRSIQLAEKAGQTVGVIYNVSTTGYSGEIDALIAFDKASGKITGIKIMRQTETPGLGANATNPKFTGQFIGKAASKELAVTKGTAYAANEIQAITASTITSRAVVKGVNIARTHFVQNYAKQARS